MTRKIVCILLVFCLLSALPMTAEAAGSKQIESYAQSLIQYYLHHQEAAEDVIWDILNKMKMVDIQQAEVWENIMEDWSWINSGMPAYEGVLPDGLPQDDSLAIVVLGYGLNEDGSMKEELVDRLVVALASALKYPNAWIVLTGGQTSVAKGVTEAGQMSAWLQEKGIDPSRLILEKQSLSTTANAVNVYKLLTASYPQVDSIAVISSDYHITWGCTMFTTVSHYKSANGSNRALKLVGNAVCNTGQTGNTLTLQAWGISAITGVSFDENASAPSLYYVERPTEPAEQPTEAMEAEEAQPAVQEPLPEMLQTEEKEETQAKKPSFVPILLFAAVAVAVYVLTPKKPRKKNRRQRPKMNFED